MHAVALTSAEALAAAFDTYRWPASVELYELLHDAGIGAGTRLLDVAVGTAIASEPLAEAGAVLTGLDASDGMLAKARARIPAATFVQGRPERLPFGDASFDAALCADAFHVVEDQPAALAELHRVVRAGGTIAIWWTVLSVESDLLGLRAAASHALGLPPVPEPLAKGFRSFYGQTFAERTVRVVPTVADTTVERWIGYERTRPEVLAAYGERADAWYDALAGELEQRYGSPIAAMRARLVQYVYLARV